MSARRGLRLDVETLPSLPPTPYTATFEQVWRIVLEKHFDPTLGCQDWPARQLKKFGKRLADAKDAAAAYAIMNGLLGTLKQSHFKVVAPRASPAPEASGPARAPIHVRVLGAEVVVVDRRRWQGQERVPRGAVIVAIDGRPVAEIVAEAQGAALREGEVAFQTSLAVESALHGQVGATRKITFKRPRQGRR